MQKTFENSCAKGCLVYVVVLVLILVLSTIGLGGLSSRFGVGAAGSKQGAPATTADSSQASTAPQQPMISTSQNNTTQADADLPQQQAQPTATSQPAQPVQPAPQVQPQPQEAPTQQVQSAPPPPVASEGTAQIDTQGGGITGQATSPFYIVQAGDTLWDIAIHFGTTVEALRAANNLGEEFIKPNQLLYLVQEQTPPQQPAPQATVAPSVGAGGAPPPVSEPGTTSPPALPQMPDTGINTRP